MPQLQINQGPQDALLYDNSRSYFTNVGYVRTSNFQTEYRDVQSQNSPAFGSTVQYVIPKAADLLGPTDLIVTIPKPKAPGKLANTLKTNDVAYAQWVDELGFAMIEKVTFSVGSNDIETITGEQLQIQNELMTTDEMRLGFNHVMKSGRPAFQSSKVYREGSGALTDASFNTAELPGNNQTALETDGIIRKKFINKDYSRLIEMKYSTADYVAATASAAATGKCTKLLSGARTLTIPLGLFFTKHVSQYFPLAAVAGCNDVRISIKFRNLNELVQLGGVNNQTTSNPQTNSYTSISDFDGALEAKLRLHYVHVTGPEAQVLMNKEHVRLLKLYQHEHKLFSQISGGKLEMDLSFLHPVSTLIITIRREEDMNSQIGSIANAVDAYANGDAAGKGFFFYHGDGSFPNYDQYPYAVKSGNATDESPGTVKVSSIALTLNGQERHPGLEKGIEYDYLMNRLMPMLHSNSNQYNKQMLAFENGKGGKFGLGSGGHSHQFYAQQGSKNIMVYPFSLNPEGSNPSGAVNFSKVSHAKLSLHLDTDVGAGAVSELSTNVAKTIGMPGSTAGNGSVSASALRVDVYALYYNWLQIKDGRALLSFA